MTAYCEICYATAGPFTPSPTEPDDLLCPTCLRFARLALEHGHADEREAFIHMERMMSDGKTGFLDPDRWLPEEVSALDKFYTLSDARHRLTWLSLSRSFRNIRRKDRESQS